MTDFFSCSKCNSKNVTITTPDDRNSSDNSNETFIRCKDCGHEMHYDYDSDTGKDGIVYYRKGKPDPNRDDIRGDIIPDSNS